MDILGIPHQSLNIFKRSTDFLSRVKNPRRVKYVLCFSEKLAHLFPEHSLQIGRTNDPVIVFSGNRPPVARNKRIHPRRKLAYDAARFRVLEVHEGNDVKISIFDMSRYGINQGVLAEKFCKLREKCRVRIEGNDDVVNEWGGVVASQVFAKQ